MRIQLRLHLDEHLTPVPLHSWDVTVYGDDLEREAMWTALAGPFDNAEDALREALSQVERYLRDAPRQGVLPLPHRRPSGR